MNKKEEILELLNQGTTLYALKKYGFKINEITSAIYQSENQSFIKQLEDFKSKEKITNKNYREKHKNLTKKERKEKISELLKQGTTLYGLKKRGFKINEITSAIYQSENQSFIKQLEDFKSKQKITNKNYKEKHKNLTKKERKEKISELLNQGKSIDSLQSLKFKINEITSVIYQSENQSFIKKLEDFKSNQNKKSKNHQKKYENLTNKERKEKISELLKQGKSIYTLINLKFKINEITDVIYQSENQSLIKKLDDFKIKQNISIKIHREKYKNFKNQQEAGTSKQLNTECPIKGNEIASTSKEKNSFEWCPNNHNQIEVNQNSESHNQNSNIKNNVAVLQEQDIILIRQEKNKQDEEFKALQKTFDEPLEIEMEWGQVN